MNRNHTFMQFFEWHVEADGAHWNRLAQAAPKLKKHGIDGVWIPPVTKGQSVEDTGYGIYDGYDLGEFDQKGTIRTKYGTKKELQDAIASCHDNGISVYVDIVMNHKAGADETEVFRVVEVDPMDRNKEISEPFEIEGWTKFTFQNRSDQYSSFKWNFNHFNGTDYDAKNNQTGIYRILGENKTWNDKVDPEFGNYDYLMFANIDYDQPAVQEEMIAWGKWLMDTLDCDGYRLDAIKHINYDFINQFSKEMIDHSQKNFYLVGEFWKSNLKDCREYLEQTNYILDLFDVALHYNFCQSSKSGRDFDLSKIFSNTLVHSNSSHAVTFVDNHDSQPNESLESWVEDWFKPIAYSLILLRMDGYPCVFYGDYYGVGGSEPIDGKKEMLDKLLYARYHKAYGEQKDYFDHYNTIGWVRMGIEEFENSGCAVVASNGDAGEKKMFVGEHRAGEIWTDFTNNRKDHITIEENGFATFPVNGGSVSVWMFEENQQT